MSKEKQNVLTIDMPKGTKLKEWHIKYVFVLDWKKFGKPPKLDEVDQVHFIQQEGEFWLCHLILNGKITVAYLCRKSTL